MAVPKSGTEAKDVTELFDLLESNDTQVVIEIKQLIQENLSSTRESWLLNSLLDYYLVSHSERTMEILSGVREPHDKHLLDKLNDGLKHSAHKLLTVRLLLFLVIKQPSWIHKLVQSSVFNTTIKSLKHDLDIPFLMTGVLVITNYLPIDPLSVYSHLNEIFDVFTRLLAFSKKKTGNIPDIFLLHLQVAVYALFHRLYGMYPCNFLAYLRHHFSRREHHDVYQDALKPMIERVRLHPLLITGSKEYESTQQRWRKMETQDIVVDCAKMSLDIIEGTWEEVRCPVVAPRYHLFTPMVTQQSSTPSLPAGQALHCAVSVGALGHAEQSPPFIPMSASESNVLWSPSGVCGLSTPPPSQMTANQAGNADYTTSIQHSYPGTSYTNTPLITPSQTPRATPPVIVDDLFDRSRNSRSNLSKRLSGSSLPSPKLQMCTSNIAMTSFDSQASLSVPPSPLRPEFTSEPPVGTHRTQPLPKAAQKLPFDDIPERVAHNNAAFSHNLSQKLDSSLVEKFQTLSRETIEESPYQGVSPDNRNENKLKSQSDPANSNSNTDLHHHDDRGRAMSIKIVDKVVQEMNEEHDNADDTDEEVREIIQEDISEESTDKLEANLELTAESVQKFMKKVNRIRFNSLTIGTSIDIGVNSGLSRSRSRSCPQLQKPFPEDTHCTGSRALRCSSAAPQHNTQLPPGNGQDIINNSTTCGLGQGNSVSQQVPASAAQSLAQSSSIENSENEPHLTSESPYGLEIKNNEAPLSQKEKEETEMIKQIVPRPFDRIMQYSLPHSAITRCQQCKRRYVTALETTDLHSETLPKADYETPLFSTFSPPELLDRHLQLGGEVHAKELSRIPITSQDSINWTHFGGLPPADEINILRGQILLIQNQLMYERHKRELHAKRNRRLLSKITHSKAMEERNSALMAELTTHSSYSVSRVSSDLCEFENELGNSLDISTESDTMLSTFSAHAETSDNQLGISLGNISATSSNNDMESDPEQFSNHFDMVPLATSTPLAKFTGRYPGSAAAMGPSDTDSSEYSSDSEDGDLGLTEIATDGEPTDSEVSLKLCKTGCLEDVEKTALIQSRKRLESKTFHEKTTWMYEKLSESKPSGGSRLFFLIDGGRTVCAACFREYFGVGRNFYYKCLAKYRKGCRLPGLRKGRGNSKFHAQAVLWLEDFAKHFGDSMPDKGVNDILLPYKTRKTVIYEQYRDDMNSKQQLSVGKTTFLNIWKNELPNLKIKQSNSFSKCEKCTILERKLEGTRDKMLRQKYKQAIQDHNQRQMLERKHYYRKREEAESQPNKFMSIIIDGMDQSKTNLPHMTGRISKSIDVANLLVTHIQGVINHGMKRYRLTTYIDINEYSHDSNMVMNVILKTLAKTTMELVHLSFLYVGHTHEDIDAAFSKIAENLRKNDAETIPRLQALLPSCEQLTGLYDIKEWLSPYINRISKHSQPLHFKFSKGINYKLLCEYKGRSGRPWKSMPGTVLSEIPPDVPNILIPQKFNKIDVKALRKNILNCQHLFHDDENESKFKWWQRFLSYIEDLQTSQATLMEYAEKNANWILPNLPKQRFGDEPVNEASLPFTIVDMLDQEFEDPELDQLRLQENEIQNLQVSMKLLQQENQQLKGSKDSDHYELQVQLRASLEDNQELKYTVSELQSQIETLKMEKAEALKMLQQSDYRLFNTLRDLQTLQGQVAITKELQDKIAHLNKELLLMGELQQRYQEQLAVKHSRQPKVEEEYHLTSLHSEIKALQKQLDQKQVQISGMQRKVLELEETIKHKDITQTDLKKSLEMVKSSHQEEIKAVDCKYQSSVKIGQQLESHIMDLYGQIETLKRANRQRGSVKVSSDVPVRGHGNLGNQNRTLSSPTNQNSYNSQSECAKQSSSGSPSQKDSRHQPYMDRPDSVASGIVSQAAPEPYTVLSQQLATSSLAGHSSSASLLSQSDAFSQRGPLLNQSVEEESAPAQTIALDIRHSPCQQRTQASQALTTTATDPADQSKHSLQLSAEIECDSLSSCSNALTDSGVGSRT